MNAMRKDTHLTKGHVHALSYNQLRQSQPCLYNANFSTALRENNGSGSNLGTRRVLRV